MPYRAPVPALGSYRPYHVSAATTSPQAAGAQFDGTSATAVAPGSVTITLSGWVDGDPGLIQVGSRLVIDTGAPCEIVKVTAISGPAAALQVTATFANTHSGTYRVRLNRGSVLGTILVGQPGTTMVLTLYNGHPNAGGTAMSVITPPTAADEVAVGATFDKGVYYTYTGTTAGDVTIMAAPAGPP